jgi:hypothetical protein
MKTVNLAAKCMGLSPNQLISPVLLSKKSIAILTTMGSLLRYRGNPRLSSAVASILGIPQTVFCCYGYYLRTRMNPQIIFCCCKDTGENTNYLLPLVGQGGNRELHVSSASEGKELF